MKIKGRHSKYLHSLGNDKQWEDVKRTVRTRDGHKCRLCGSQANLDVHHLTYTVDGQDIRGHESEHTFCLVTLCRTCHDAVHKDLKHEMNPKNYGNANK